MEVVQNFLGWLFAALSGIISGLLGFLTFNPLSGLGNPVNSALVSCVAFVDRFIPATEFFAAVGSAAPWFVLLVIAGIVWRWVRGL